MSRFALFLVGRLPRWMSDPVGRAALPPGVGTVFAFPCHTPARGKAG